MKSVAKNFNLNNLSASLIHGRTKIELFDDKKNIVRVVESENTFQDTVIANFLSSMGENEHSVNSFNWFDIVGGIFLFENTVAADSKYMPSGNRMIGNGSYGLANNTLPNELGTFNVGNSGVDMEHGTITQVYDFATNQANGSFNCVCLTSKIGGLIGYGNTSGRNTSVNFSSEQGGQITLAINQCIVDNTLYTFTLSGDNMTVTKEHRSITQGSVFRGEQYSKVIDMSSIKPTGVTLNTDLRAFPLNNDKIRVYSPFVNTVAASGKVYCFDYDPTDDSVVKVEITNSSAHTIRTTNNAVTFTPDGYFVTYDNDSYLQVFNVSNSSHVIDYRTETLFGNGSGNYDFSPSDGLFISYSTGLPYMVDITNLTVKPMNAGYAGNYVIRNMRFPSIDAVGFTYSSGNPVLIKNPLYLATINNLGEEVQKGNSQTMKITYVLSKA